MQLNTEENIPYYSMYMKIKCDIIYSKSRVRLVVLLEGSVDRQGHKETMCSTENILDGRYMCIYIRKNTLKICMLLLYMNYTFERSKK